MAQISSYPSLTPQFGDKVLGSNTVDASGYPVSGNPTVQYTLTSVKTLVDQQFIHQRGLCAICEKPEVNKDVKGKIKWLSVDHNHATGELRGLVCYRCNTALGKFGDSIVTLQSAIKYLEERGSYGE